ncbi:MAG TPA: prepilin-type N-terminal cleavage/methylation domain-containing protein [Chthoniobacteraceae bacterium]|nr:prepilin-type N-terminal cleavage/methylation domain-containing protein [Chthoniobacteraceae bacterium]
MNATRPRLAFTVLELMLVIIIAAVLAVLSWAALGSISRRGENLRCVNHLRQIGVAIHAYAGEFHGMVLPRNYGLHRSKDDPDKPTGAERAWYSRLYYRQYVADPAIFSCPSLPLYPKGAKPTPIRNAGAETYAMRSWVVPGNAWEPQSEEHKPLSAITEPANFFLIVDSVWLSSRNQGYGVAPGNKDQNIHVRHNGKANALFADGHVEAKPAAYFRELGSGSQAQYGTGRDFSVWEDAQLP